MKIVCFINWTILNKEEERARASCRKKNHDFSAAIMGYYPVENRQNCGLGSYISKAIRGADGILTELKFSPNPNFKAEHDAGLLVVIEAVRLQKPVVICVEGDRHDANNRWIYDDFISAHEDQELGIALQDYKDWDKAIELLESLESKSRGPKAIKKEVDDIEDFFMGDDFTYDGEHATDPSGYRRSSLIDPTPRNPKKR